MARTNSPIPQVVCRGTAVIAAPCATALIHTLAARSLDLDTDPFAHTFFEWATRDSIAVIIAVSFPFALHQAWKARRPLRQALVLGRPGLDRTLVCVQVVFVVVSIMAAF